MAHSSSKAAGGAGALPGLSGLSLWGLVGVLCAMLVERAGIFAAAPPVAPQWLRWMLPAVLLSATLRWPPPARFRAALAALAGLCLAGLQLLDWHAHRLHDADEGRVLVQAAIVSLPEPQADGLRFVAVLRPARDDAVDPGAANEVMAGHGAPRWPMRVQMRWRGGATLHVGERWQFIAQLTALHPARNPGQGWFGTQDVRSGLHALGQVVDSRLTMRIAPAPPSIELAREALSARIRARVTERDAAALLAALAVGDTRSVSRQQWRVFNAVGITHLIAISGLHVTLFGVLCAALARRVWSSWPWLRRHVRREHCAAVVAVTAAAGYALLSGFSVPAQRTLLMLAVWQGLRCAARPAAVAPALAAALVCVLLRDPLAPLSAGFWLSFVAVAVLMHVGPATGEAGGEPEARRALLLRAVLRACREAAALWHTQWRVALGLLPVTLAVFGSTSLAGLAVNLLAIPLFGFVLVPLILLSLPLLACAPQWPVLPLDAAAWIASALQPWLERVAAWPWALWRMDAPPWAVLLAVPAVWLLLLPTRWSQRSTALCALLPLCCPRSDAPAPGEFSATVFDTGQSLALIVRTAHHAMLYDVGEHWGSAGAVSEAVLVPALRALHVRRIDRLLVPRLDADRSAGLAAIDAALPVMSWQAGGAESQRPPEFAGCPRGERWTWDGVRFENLVADECVLRIVAASASDAAAAGTATDDNGAAGASLLIGGELDRAGQQRLLDRGLTRQDALILPRHGSGSAYLPAFRDATAPRWVVAAQSARGAAASRVRGTLSAFGDVGAQVWVTGEQGAVTLRGSLRVLDVAPAR